MTELEHRIQEAENKWLRLLNAECGDIFQDFFLPSHDLSHHQRVWRFARNVMLEFESAGIEFPPGFSEQLILAVFFHDAGMCWSVKPDHGSIGKDFCRHFLQRNSPLAPAGADEILEAVKEHDNKEYILHAQGESPPYPSLLTLLNIADDLDALGYIGIYRYAEIYLMRNIPLEEIAARVLENLERRINHMIKSLPSVESVLAQECLKRHDIIHLFYSMGADPSPGYSSIRNQVLASIQDLVCKQKIHPLVLTEEHLVDFTGAWNFWNNLQQEWHQTTPMYG